MRWPWSKVDSVSGCPQIIHSQSVPDGAVNDPAFQSRPENRRILGPRLEDAPPRVREVWLICRNPDTPRTLRDSVLLDLTDEEIDAAGGIGMLLKPARRYAAETDFYAWRSTSEFDR